VTALLERCTFPPAGTPLECAVSGGADSSALLVLAAAAGCTVTAHHVDHGLRPGSSGEAAAVAALAARVGAGFRSVSVAVSDGPNLEARARAARARVLPAGAATGHTMDDQAETIVINLLRGAGSDGLSGMQPGPRHPLLGIRRAETEAVCGALGVIPVHDPSNASGRHLRNRVRHQLLPLCAELSGRDLVPVLARQAALLRAESRLLDRMAEIEIPDPTDVHRVRAVAERAVPLARRAIRRWLQDAVGSAVPPDPETDVDGTRHPPGSADVARVLAVACGDAVATEVTGGIRVQRSRGRLSLRPVARAGARPTAAPPLAPPARGGPRSGSGADQVLPTV